MPDVDNRRGAPVRLQLDLFDAAEDGKFVRPGAGRIDDDAGSEAFLPGAELPAGAQALGRMDPGAGDNVHATGFGPPAVVLEQHGGVAGEGAGVQPGGAEGVRNQGRAELEGLGVGDPAHVAAGLPTDAGVVADQHKAAGRKHRFRPGGVLAGDEFEGAERKILDDGGAVAGDQLPGRARGGVVRQHLLGFHQRDAALSGKG